MFRRIRMFGKLWQFGLPREQQKARRLIPLVKPGLEKLEDRTLLSASVVDSQTVIAAMVQQEAQLFVTVQAEALNIGRAIAQEITQALVQLDQILGIAPNLQNLSLNSLISPNGNASGSGTGSTTTQPSDGIQPNAPVEPDAAPGGPDIGGTGGYLWDPTNLTNASIAANWDYDGLPQNNPATAKKPGDTPEPVTFDPQLTKAPGLHGDGAAPITWDYSVSFPQMNLGGQSPYTGKQTINSGITVLVDGGVLANNTSNSLASKLYLFYTDGSSIFQVNGNSTITNMTLTGAYQGQFIIGGGTMNIAQSPAYTETIGVNVYVTPGATLYDWGETPLTYTNDNVQLTILGTMNVANGLNPTNMLIDNGGFVDDFINVNGGTILYVGKGGVTDIIKMPIAVQNGGAFKVNGGKLIVQGENSSTNGASVWMGNATSSAQLSFGGTLECDSGYNQWNGLLETMDTSTCTLQSGSNNSYGTVNIAGGQVVIDGPNSTAYGKLNVNCSSLQFSGQLTVAIDASTGKPGPGTSDLLNVSGTTNLQAGCTLYVWVNNGPPKGGSSWLIIQDGQNNNNITGDFAKPITTNPQTNLNGTVNKNQYLLSF